MKLRNLFTLALTSIGLAASAQSIVDTLPSNKNVVLEELTGKTCQYCPDGHVKAQRLSDNNPGRVVLLNIHTGSYAAGTPNYRTTWGDYVGGLFPVTGYPTGAVNRTNFGSTVMTSRGDWISNAAGILTTASPVNVGATDSVNLDNRSIIVDVEAYYTANGPGTTNRLHAIVVQNNIPGPQTGAATWNPSAILPNGDYNHKHMVRHALTPNLGSLIDTITAGSLYSKRYTHSLPMAINGITVNLADIEVAVYVSEGSATGTILTGNYAASHFITSTPLSINSNNPRLDISLNAICDTTVDASIKITNVGANLLNTVTIEYTVNGGTAIPYVHTFANPLATAAYSNVDIIGIPGLNANGANNQIDFDITMLNGVANPQSQTSTAFVRTANVYSSTASTALFTLNTDNYGSEISWEFVDETTGSTIASGGNYPDVAGGGTYTSNPALVDGHCYKIQVNDSYGDGMCCSYGNGSFNLVVGGNTVVTASTFGSIAGARFTFDLQVNTATALVKESVEAVRIMPNPVQNNMTVEFTTVENTTVNISVINALGQKVQQLSQNSLVGTNLVEINTSNLTSGVYFLNIASDKGQTTKRFVVEK